MPDYDTGAREDRKVAALEQMATTLANIQGQLLSLNHNVDTLSRQLATSFR